MDALDRLGAICRGLPEAEPDDERLGPTWRVRDKIFAFLRSPEGRPAAVLKAPLGSQEVLLGADPDRFFRPRYVGHKGWVGVWLDRDPGWEEVAALIRRSYSLIAPKRLAARMETER